MQLFDKLRSAFNNKPRPKTVSDNLINRVAYVPQRTPDLAMLQSNPSWLLFDYGHTLPDLPKVCDGYTTDNLNLWRRIPSHPFDDPVTAIAFKQKGQRNACVKGNIYLVPYQKLVELDGVRQNGVLFKRKRVRLNIPMVDISEAKQARAYNGKLAVNEAWAYYGIPEPWLEKMQWDLEFYRGYGEYRPADFVPASPNERKYLLKDHYVYRTPVDPYKISKFPHYRPEYTQICVKQIDKQENAKADRELIAAANRPKKWEQGVTIINTSREKVA